MAASSKSSAVIILSPLDCKICLPISTFVPNSAKKKKKKIKRNKFRKDKPIKKIKKDQQHEGREEVGTSQTNNKGHTQVDLLTGSNNALGDDVALHDSSKDVDEDGGHPGVTVQDFECLSHLLLVGTTTNIQEVSRASVVQLMHD